MYKQKTSKKPEKLRLVAALFLVIQFAFGTIVAQSPSPSKSPTGKEPTVTPGPVDSSKHPTTTVNFTIEREGSVFRELETKDVEVYFDGQKIELKPDALQKDKQSEGVKILFVIDKSGSMRPKSGIDKLKAAQDALYNFVNSLSPVDEVAISTFGIDYTEVLPLTKVENKGRINEAIDKLAAPDATTNFYSGIDSAVNQASNKEIKNIIFLSDAKEDNEDFKKLTDKDSEKRRREKDLSGKMGPKGIRFFAVAIGDPYAKPDEESFVDVVSMKNIAEPTQGTAEVINVPEIEKEAGNDKEKSKNLIADRLKKQLTEIKKALKFSYALVFDLPPGSRSNGNLELKFNITDGATVWQQTTTYPYTVKDGKPVFERARISPFLPSSAEKELRYGDISLIYLLMLIPLGILSLIPGIFNKFAAAAEERKVNEAIVRLNPGSPFIGTQCPGESGPLGKRFSFREGDTLIVCPQCGVPHHLVCWAENKFQCMNRICESRYQIPEQVLVRHNVRV